MNTCEAIASELGSLFSCAPHDKYTRVRTPFLYPDGDVIDLFVRDTGDSTLLTDLGESLRWLKSHTASPRRTQKQGQLIDDVCLNHGVELYRGMLVARAKPGDSLAEATTRLAQAALRVGDIWFTYRTRTVQSVTDEVADFFVERELKFDRGAKRPGRSGYAWTIDFHVLGPRHSSLVNVLATGNRAAARGIAERVLAAWHDLSHLAAADTSFVSLFDDTMDVWTDEDFRLVESLSTIARWSRPDEVEHLLKA